MLILYGLKRSLPPMVLKLLLTVKTVAITFSTWDMDPHRWSRCECFKMPVYVSVLGPEFKLQYHCSILLFLIHFLLLCLPFKVLLISSLLTMVLKLRSLVLRLKTQFLKVWEIEIQVLNLENWDISNCWPYIEAVLYFNKIMSMIVQFFCCLIISQTVLSSNIKLMPFFISRIVLMRPRRRVKNCWQLLRNFKNCLKKQMKVNCLSRVCFLLLPGHCSIFKIRKHTLEVKESAIIQLFKLNIDDSSHCTVILRPILFSYLWLKYYYMYTGRLELDSRLQEQENSQTEKTKDYGECLSIRQVLPSASLRPISLCLSWRYWIIIIDHIQKMFNLRPYHCFYFLQRRDWVNWRESWRMQMTY